MRKLILTAFPQIKMLEYVAGSFRKLASALAEHTKVLDSLDQTMATLAHHGQYIWMAALPNGAEIIEKTMGERSMFGTAHLVEMEQERNAAALHEPELLKLYEEEVQRIIDRREGRISPPPVYPVDEATIRMRRYREAEEERIAADPASKGKKRGRGENPEEDRTGSKRKRGDEDRGAGGSSNRT